MEVSSPPYPSNISAPKRTTSQSEEEETVEGSSDEEYCGDEDQEPCSNSSSSNSSSSHHHHLPADGWPGTEEWAKLRQELLAKHMMPARLPKDAQDNLLGTSKARR
jgi:hypothetical protein